MPCPKCDNGDVRPAEKGMMADNYYCKRCDKTYAVTSPKAKITLSTIALGAVALLFGVG